MNKIPILIGPTSIGKTSHAVQLAKTLGGDVISADSRQVYKGLTIGAGKDLEEYRSAKVDYHLIDFVPLTQEYTLADYQQDFHSISSQLITQNKPFVWCGGTGLYILSILKNYDLTQVPDDVETRTQLEEKTETELLEIYQDLPHLPQTSIDTRKRLIRAIQIGIYLQNHSLVPGKPIDFDYQIFCLITERNSLKDRINKRLDKRIEQGLFDETENLLATGTDPSKLIRLGLEYKFTTEYLLGKRNKTETIDLLRIAIHQYSKRQMTFFRKMEKDGLPIRWVHENEQIQERILGELSH